MTTATVEQRLTRLESDVQRLGHQSAETDSAVRQIAERTEGAIEHLSSAVGDLSQGQRGLAHDLAALTGKVDRMDQVLADHTATLADHTTMLRAHGDLLREILAVVKGR
jgi:hypothetical protein